MAERGDTLPGLDVATTRPPAQRPAGRLVRVRPDITAVDASFTYEVPTSWDDDGRAELVRVGSMVRVDFAGRRTAGWVTEVDVAHDPAVDVRPLAKVSGLGPPQSIIDLAEWAARRWYGRPVHLLRAASPPKMVPGLPAIAASRHEQHPDASVFVAGEVTVVTSVPADRGDALALAAASLGRALILVPTVADRRHIATVLRRAGVTVAEYPDQWARSAAGAVTVATRLGAFAPIENLDAVLVIDEHDHAFKEERTPSWNARDVGVERARRDGAACVLMSPCPSLEAREIADRRLVPERSAQRQAWPLVDVVDMRRQERTGLLSDRLADVVRGDGAVACIINRKGRSQLLACTRCDSLADCEACGATVAQPDGVLVCRSCGTERPVVCRQCGATSFKLLRPGVSRLAVDLEALARRDVLEVTGDDEVLDLDDSGLVVGTEAVLHRVERLDGVVFLDFDQELTRPRSRAPEDAFALLALAARRVGPRTDGGRIVVQTRRPNDVVIEAALHGEPARLALAQRDVRSLLAQPPYGAWAVVSGAGAQDYVDGLASWIDAHRSSAPVEVRSMGDRWRVSAPNHDDLLAALHAVERPQKRLRVVVDPLDL